MINGHISAVYYALNIVAMINSAGGAYLFLAGLGLATSEADMHFPDMALGAGAVASGLTLAGFAAIIDLLDRIVSK